MITFTLNQLAKLLSSTVIEEKDLTFKGISTDTRTLQPGNLFIALEGENHDGHLFVEEARKKGAVAALVVRKTISSLPQIMVTDTVKALGLLAASWRKQFDLPIIGLTGSNGKTTLKNLVASILRAATSSDAVLATEGNLNNHIGVPLMLTRLNNYHQYSVIEMGMNHFGEIAYLTQMVLPQVAIVNNAATAHLQGVNDLAGVARAKGEIFLGLSATGTAILNADDTFFSYWKELVGERKCLTFGMQQHADVSASLQASKHTLKQQITIITPKGKIEVLLPLLGKHNAMNALAATAACLALNIPLDVIKNGLENVEPAKGRLQMYSFAQDINIIDDTYNANPASLQAAINVLAAIKGNKVLILGDMRELGDNAADLHATMGKAIKAAGIQHLYTYGELSETISKNFGNGANHFLEQDQLIEAIQKDLCSHSTYLIKGSRSMKMENVVNVLKQALKQISQ